jgi:2',3'-cyclic-nucleotide 2'-phosphodiesterase (5'-nucleotidase family)
VVKIAVNGQPLDDNRIYSLSYNAYLINGGDNYRMFKGVKFLIPEESAQIDSSALANLITSSGEVVPKVEGRIKRVDN